MTEEDLLCDKDVRTTKNCESLVHAEAIICIKVQSRLNDNS